MKKRIAICLPLIAMLVTGCSIFNRIRSSSSSEEQSSYSSSSEEESSSSSSESTYSSEQSSSTSSSSTSSEDCSSSSEQSSSQSSSSSSSSSSKPTGSTTIKVYATNDMHGTIYSNGYNYPGIGKVASYLKACKDQGGTLLIDQGDTWQGSVYSNYNRGALITDIMNYIQYDARTVGNHDFDWGPEFIENNKNMSYAGYSTPVLAGNVYDFTWPSTTGTQQQSNLGAKSVTYTVNGVKIGILGCIGEDQINDITSNNTQHITFTNHVDFIKDEAKHLRQDEGCDIVICSIHTGQEDVMYNSLDEYVDLVLCGHTHKQQKSSENGVWYVQNYGNTGSVASITLNYNFDTGAVTTTDVSHISGHNIDSLINDLDPTIEHIMETYRIDTDTNANPNEVLAANVSGSFERYNHTEHLMTKSMLDYAIECGYNVDFAVMNQSRAALNSGPFTYENLYASFPFDNLVYIADITGKELLEEAIGFSYICKNPSFTTKAIDFNQTYKVAVLDFCYFHINVYNGTRYYNYYPQTGGTSTTYLDMTYREILKYWLKQKGYNQENKTLYASDFESSLDAYNTSGYYEA